MARHCDNCRFWVGWDEPGEDEPTGTGWCKRYPATLEVPDDAGSEEGYTQPLTFYVDWCGEWRRRRRALAFLLRLAGKLLRRKANR